MAYKLHVVFGILSPIFGRIGVPQEDIGRKSFRSRDRIWIPVARLRGLETE